MSKADSQPAQDEINHKSLVDFNEELEEEEEESLSRNDSPNGESSKLTFITMEVSGRKTFPDDRNTNRFSIIMSLFLAFYCFPSFAFI